jgi:hypothetical protein
VPKRSIQKKSAWGPSLASEPDHGREKRRKLHGRVSSEIRISESREREFYAFQNRDSRFPDRREQLSIVEDRWQALQREWTVDKSTTMSHRGSGNREFGGCVLIDIANRKIPMENMTEGIWERSLGPGLRQRASTEGAVGDRRFASREDLCFETAKMPKPR